MLKLLKHLKIKEWVFALCGVVFIVAQVWLDLKMPDYMNVITQIAQGGTNAATGAAYELSDIWLNGGYMLLCTLGSMACSIITSFFVVNIAADFSARLRENLYTKVQHFSMSEINKFSTASLITRSTNDVQQVQMLITMGLQMIIKAPITAAWAIVKIAGKQWQWSAAVAVAVCIMLAGIITIMLLVVEKFKKIQRFTDNLNQVTRENLTGIRVIRAYNAEAFQQNKFEAVNEEFTSTNLFTGKVMAFMNPLMSLVMNGISLAIYWIGAVVINQATLPEVPGLFGDMVVFMSYGTIINICDVVSSDTPPENPYEGQLWVDTSVTPPETKVWDGLSWSLQNGMETVRTTIETIIKRNAEFQQSVDGLNSYVSSLTETVETVSNEQDIVEERVLNAESQISRLQHSVDGLSVTMQEQYIGGINYVQNSAGLNGITDDWSYAGTLTVDNSTDTMKNTISDSCFLLGAYSSITQYIRNVVPGTYTISIRAKKTSTMSSYFYVTYNGNKTKYLFSQTAAFDWTDYSVTIPDVTDPTLRIYCYSRDASLYVSDIMLSEGSVPRKWTPAPNEIYTSEVKIDKRGIEVSNNASSQRTVITNTEFAGYYNDEVIFTLNKDETQTKKTTVDGELTVGRTKFVPMPTASEGLNIVILD